MPLWGMQTFCPWQGSSGEDTSSVKAENRYNLAQWLHTLHSWVTGLLSLKEHFTSDLLRSTASCVGSRTHLMT